MPQIIERAFELARSGQYPNTIAIVRQLKSEGYEAVDHHFDSRSLKQTLRQLCKDASASTPAVEAS